SIVKIILEQNRLYTEQNNGVKSFLSETTQVKFLPLTQPTYLVM
ncbi:MAG: hypothetical protein ACI897_001355, partial [Flavobacteriales bacterium]